MSGETTVQTAYPSVPLRPGPPGLSHLTAMSEVGKLITTTGCSCELGRSLTVADRRLHLLEQGAWVSSEVTSGASPPIAIPRSAVTTTTGQTWSRPDGRRMLQLVVATIWLVDGILQLQAFFFTKSFGLQMISGMSSGNPSIIARPISWSGTIIGHHAVLTDALFALVQIGIGVTIGWRPTVRIGLGVSIVWAVGVWWVGEGLGGIVNGSANPVNGAPGAVILYALLAVLLWPHDRAGEEAPFIAARAVGAPIAKGLWLALWGSLSYFAVVGANRSSRGLHDLINAEANGEPGWVARIDHRVAHVVDHKGLALTLLLACLLLLVSIGILLPRPVANGAVVLAAVLSASFWVLGENFGAIFTNGATDVNSGPLLMALAVTFWRWSPSTATSPSPAVTSTLAPGAEGA